MSQKSQIDVDVFNIHTVSVADPAAATAVTYTTLNNERLQLIAATFTLTTDANAANRVARIHMPGLASDPAFATPNSQPASKNWTYHFALLAAPVSYGGDANFMFGTIPDAFFTFQGAPVRVSVSNMQVGDQLSNYALTFKRWYNL